MDQEYLEAAVIEFFAFFNSQLMLELSSKLDVFFASLICCNKLYGFPSSPIRGEAWLCSFILKEVDQIKFTGYP